MKKSALLLVFILCISGCGKLKGQFAFQTPDDKCYKIKEAKLEFDSSQEIKWVYTFNSNPSERVKLGVIILKKELGWIDILTTSDHIDARKNILYGTLKELDPGDYKLVITEITIDGNRKVDEVEFYLYSDEEEQD
jgi:hypothetical protein